MKYVLVVLVVVIGLLLLRSAARRRDEPPAAPPPRADKPRPALDMVACAHCGVHLPGGDALVDAAGRSFCTDDHRRAGPR